MEMMFPNISWRLSGNRERVPRTLWVGVILLVIFLPTNTPADTIELKAGGRVEGEVISTSATEVQIKVGSQLITFPRSEVLRVLIGDSPPPSSQPATQPSGPRVDPFVAEMSRGIRRLKALQSATLAGVNIRDYSSRVLDAKVEVDEVAQNLAGHTTGRPLVSLLQEALDYHVIAMNGWSGGLSRNWVRVPSGLPNRCPEIMGPDATISSGVLWEYSTQPLWTCARRALEKLEDAMRTLQAGEGVPAVEPKFGGKALTPLSLKQNQDESLKVRFESRGQDNAEMVLIPEGAFTMGDSHGDGDADETPAHQASVGAFWLDRTEVTNGEFARFIQTRSTTQSAWRQDANSKDSRPAVNVSWSEALAYCVWAGKRLPTEAEWEYAARGIDARKYPWGNVWEDSRARFEGNWHGERAAPVGSYPSGASPFGVLDLAGNVWEWTSSLYKPYPYRATDGRENLNSTGARVYRGGGWFDGPRRLRSAMRLKYGPTDRDGVLGFRCAQNP